MKGEIITKVDYIYKGNTVWEEKVEKYCQHILFKKITLLHKGTWHAEFLSAIKLNKHDV